MLPYGLSRLRKDFTFTVTTITLSLIALALILLFQSHLMVANVSDSYYQRKFLTIKESVPLCQSPTRKTDVTDAQNILACHIIRNTKTAKILNSVYHHL